MAWLALGAELVTVAQATALASKATVETLANEPYAPMSALERARATTAPDSARALVVLVEMIAPVDSAQEATILLRTKWKTRAMALSCNNPKFKKSPFLPVWELAVRRR
jgi:hypothetical protein